MMLNRKQLLIVEWALEVATMTQNYPEATELLQELTKWLEETNHANTKEKSPLLLPVATSL